MRPAKSLPPLSKTPIVPEMVDVVIMIGNAPRQHCDRADDEKGVLGEDR